MKIEHKLQIDAIKGERIYFAEFDNFIFLADGHVGVYLKEKELKIDKAKMIQIDNKGAKHFIPEKMQECRTTAKVTTTAVKLHSGYAIKLKSQETDEQCFVQEKFLKLFDGFNCAFIKSSKDPVFVTRSGLPYGIIFPINICKELE